MRIINENPLLKGMIWNMMQYLSGDSSTATALGRNYIHHRVVFDCSNSKKIKLLRVFSMSNNFINDLISALDRVITPDTVLLKEILIVGGMPEKTENLRYLSFNRDVHVKENKIIEFSAVAVLNNRRIDHWRLEGYHKKLSQVVFSTRWTRNPLDFFLNNLRCDPELMDMIGSASANYSLLGILQMDKSEKTGFLKRKVRSIRPVVAIPGLGEEDLKKIIAFENNNEIIKSKVRGFPASRKVGH
jgi:hypothetical protein